MKTSIVILFVIFFIKQNAHALFYYSNYNTAIKSANIINTNKLLHSTIDTTKHTYDTDSTEVKKDAVDKIKDLGIITEYEGWDVFGPAAAIFSGFNAFSLITSSANSQFNVFTKKTNIPWTIVTTALLSIATVYLLYLSYTNFRKNIDLKGRLFLIVFGIVGSIAVAAAFFILVLTFVLTP